MKKIIIAALTCAIVSLVSCDKLKDTLSHDIKVNKVKFDFTAITSDGTDTKAVSTRATTNTFAGTRTVDISEIGSSELMEYAGKISKVAVNSTLLNITANPSGSYTVTNLTLTADGVPGSLIIPSYSLGSAFTPPSGMDAYTSAFIMKLLAAKTVTVMVSGQTDAPAGTTIQISYESDLVFTASVL